MATPATAVTSQNGAIDQELVAKLRAELEKQTSPVAAKPKVHTSADEFGSGDESTSKGPSITVTMEYDSEGRLHIILPANIAYENTRDTSSRNRRLIVARSTDSVPGYVLHPNGSAIPVEFSISSTLNLSVKAARV